MFHKLSVSPSGEAAARPDGGSQNNVYEESHDGSADQPRDGNCNKPSDEDVPEQTPVHRLPGAQPSHGHHRADLHSHGLKSTGATTGSMDTQ